MIYITNLADLPDHARAVAPSHLVSLVEALHQPPTPAPVSAHCHLRLVIDDIAAPLPGYVVPAEEHVSQLVDFIAEWPAEDPLLIHCVAGVSRSTAAALIALVMRGPQDAAEAGRQLRDAAPHAQPNRRIIALADQILGLDGRLIAAREAMGPAVSLPRTPLVELSLGEAEAPLRLAAARA